MDVLKFKDAEEMGIKAAEKGAELIKQALAEKGTANVILATGASQFEMLKNLIKADIDWPKINFFHLDEYIGLSDRHPASFRKYLKERFVDQVSKVGEFNYVNGTAENIEEECNRLEKLITDKPIDVAFVGIGENGHLAFNDPPADFDTEKAYIVVDLDEACRKQQLGEGWFKTIDDVPKKAVSMGIKQIMKSKHIIVTVPDERKAEAVKNTVQSEVTNMVPATIMQNHPSCYLFLDKDSASLL